MITVKPILDKRRELTNAKFPVKIRITLNRKQYYLQTEFKLTVDEFEKTTKNNPIKQLKEVKIQLNYLETKVKKIISSVKYFSFEKLKEEFYTKSVSNNSDLIGIFQREINTKINEGNISTASSYQCAINSLKKFNAKINFEFVTVEFLKKYESSLYENGKSSSTVGIYLRNLRTVFNMAIKEKLIPIEIYPFGKGKYTIPQAANPKRALTMQELKKIFEYVPNENNEFEKRSIDFFKLSYLCNGMNINDLLKLKKKNVGSDFIEYYRTKTKSNTNGLPITVPILPQITKIINKWKCTDPNNPFLFNFINSNEPMKVYKTTMQFIKVTNKYLKKICTHLGITKNCTSYFARHSYSKAMLDSGTNIAYISNSLGHKKITTTQNYLNSFDDYNKHSIASKALLNF